MPRQIDQLVIDQVRKSQLAGRNMAETKSANRSSIITISRSMGSGARIIAEKLAADLGWSLWDRELLDFMAKDARVSRRVVDEFDERSHSEIDMVVHSLLGDKEMGGFIYIRHLIAAVKYIQRLGNAVILGRGANFILPDALNVRIDATERLRVQNMVEFEGMTPGAAIEKIRNSDRERERFLTKTFGKQMVGCCIYDVCLCMDEFSNDSAVELIKTAYRLKQRNCRVTFCKAS
jgi:cytidylate kinase